MGSLKLSTLFKRYIDNHSANGNVGTAISYQTSLNSLDGFKKNLSLYDIIPRFLQDYENYMYQQKKSPSTVGIYLRQLRAIYNDAIAKNLISKEQYPFGKSKYVIPVSRNIKKALPTHEIKMLINHTPGDLEQQRALDFFILSYLSNGINFCDIARLNWNDVRENFIYYIRSKTRNTKKSNQQKIKVPLHPRAKGIIEKWGSKLNPDGYVFSILHDDLTPLQAKYRIQGFIKRNNQYMEAIRKDLNISLSLATYSARHSFATCLKRNNVSTEFISESLGHSSLLTTAAYLDSFEDKTKIEYSNLLTEFS